MSGISTHVLDTATGQPAAGIPVRLFLEEREVGSGLTNENGRCPVLLAPGAQLESGVYRIVFDIKAVYENSFFPEVEIAFRISDPSSHHHIPLLLSPYGYTTYRGS